MDEKLPHVQYMNNNNTVLVVMGICSTDTILQYLCLVFFCSKISVKFNRCTVFTYNNRCFNVKINKLQYYTNSCHFKPIIIVL